MRLKAEGGQISETFSDGGGGSGTHFDQLMLALILESNHNVNKLQRTGLIGLVMVDCCQLAISPFCTLQKT